MASFSHWTGYWVKPGKLQVLKTSLRLFKRIIFRNREAYVLKIAALSIALATSIGIVLFSIHEFGYDTSYQHAEKVFRIVQKNVDENYTGNRSSAKIPRHFITTLNSDGYNDSLIISRVKIMHGVTITANDQLTSDWTIHAVDRDIDRILSLRIEYGDMEKFRNTNDLSAIVSSQFAKSKWKRSNVVGQRIKLYTLDDTVHVSIAAVFESLPKNSHEKFDVLLPFDTAAIRELSFDPEETGVYGRTLVGLPEDFLFNDDQGRKSYAFQPVTRIYFGPRILGEAANHGDRYSIIILLCITSLIFFLALTTFINLTTITLPHRSKEMAVKKLAGTTREILVFGFIKESFLLVMTSFMISLLLIFCCQHLIASALGFDIIPMITRLDPTFMFLISALLILLMFSPIIMTLRFANASPNRLLKSDSITFPALKRYITFFQLGISIFLIIASVVVRRQINFSLVKEPGQNYDQIVYLNSPSGITNDGVYSLRDGWKKFNPNILDVMAVSQLPDRVSSKEIGSDYYLLSVDPGFLNYFNLKMLEGHWFDANSSDSSVVMNKAARTTLTQLTAPILGVVEDFNGLFNYPERPVKITRGRDYGYNWLCVRVLEVDIRRTVRMLSSNFSTSTELANVHYLNGQFKNWINYQDRLNRLSGVLTIIAGVLSCLAIYALSISLVRDKLKDIAVHTIFGASTFNITILLIRDFSRQLAIAIVVFLPISYIALNELLRTFIYTTSLSWLDPVYPLAYCIFVIVSICAFQAMNLKRMNAVNALKS